MNGLAFPLLGALAVWLVCVPAACVVARLGVAFIRRRGQPRLAEGSGTILMLLVGAALAPPLWLVWAALHQALPGNDRLVCPVEAMGAQTPSDELLFAAFVLLPLVVGAVRVARATRAALASRRRAPLAASDSAAAATGRLAPDAAAGRPAPDAATGRLAPDAAAGRLADVVARHPRLTLLRRRIALVDPVGGPGAAIRTRGLFRPRIEVARSVVRDLDDGALTAALLHEAEHARGRDPLRFALASLVVASGPCALLGRREVARWRLAREAACDRAAVLAGADPLALARALLAAASPAGNVHAAVPALGAGGADALRLRVQLLLGYVTAPPGRIRPSRGLAALGAVAAALLVKWFLLGPKPLQALHLAVEEAAALLGLL